MDTATFDTGAGRWLTCQDYSTSWPAAMHCLSFRCFTGQNGPIFMFQTPWVRDVTSCIHSHYVNHNLYHYFIISIFLDIIWQPDATLENSEVPQFPFEKNHGFSPWTLAFHRKHVAFVAFVAFRSSSFRHLDLKHLDLPQEMARKVALVPMPQAFCVTMNPMIRCWGCPPQKKHRPFAGDKARKNMNKSSTLGLYLLLPTHFRGYFPAGIESIDAALQLFDMCRPVTWHQLAGLGKCF